MAKRQTGKNGRNGSWVLVTGYGTTRREAFRLGRRKQKRTSRFLGARKLDGSLRLPRRIIPISLLLKALLCLSSALSLRASGSSWKNSHSPLFCFARRTFGVCLAARFLPKSCFCPFLRTSRLTTTLTTPKYLERCIIHVCDL